MLLQFNDTDELDAFLTWAGRGKLGQAIPPSATDPETLTESVGTTGDAAGEQAATGETAAPETADKPKRSRRTKAEIEADKSAQAAVAQGVDEVPAPTGETPAQAAIRQALEAAKLAKEAKAAGDAELAQAAAAVAEALDPTDPKLLPHEFIQKRAAELGEMQAIEHLNAARSFIAKHGMPKYNESFQLCGLHANVMQFAPAECAMHAAALEWLDKA